MNERPKNNKEETRSCYEDMPFAEIMRKMMDQQSERPGFNCGEMMSQMMKKVRTGGDPMAMCKEMMEKMNKGCC